MKPAMPNESAHLMRSSLRRAPYNFQICQLGTATPPTLKSTRVRCPKITRRFHIFHEKMLHLKR